jgi:hypothetical protein
MPSSNANLSALTTSAGALTPFPFNASTTAYTVYMPYTAYETPTRTVTPTVADTGLATVKVNGVSVTSGSASAATFINVGSNVFTIVVTAEDATTKTYTVNVIRAAASTVSSLSAIGLSAGQLSPAFSAENNSYSVDVSTEITTFAITPTSTSANSKIDVEGSDVASAAASSPINILIGSNILVVTCTAEDGISISTYTLTVKRADFSDSVSTFESKSNALGYGVSDVSILDTFNVNDLQLVNQVQSLADCAKNLPHRLMEMGIKKATELVLNNPTAASLIEQIDDLAKKYEAIKKIAELANPKNIKPETLIEALLASQGLTGIALVNKINDIVNNFSDVSGLSDILNNLNNLDVCRTTNYLPGGATVPNPTNIPLATPPPAVGGVIAPVANASYDSQPKDAYDSFIFQLKEYLDKDPQRVAALGDTDLQNYIRMLAVLNTLAYSYHDNISRTTDDSKDVEYKATYLKLVADELAKHPEWDAATKLDYNGRSAAIENEITRNTNVIRSYYSRNSAATGDWIPMYMTVYGSAAIDKTTAQDQNKADAGVKGYEGFSQSKGAYGATLMEGVSVASNYWTGKTVLEIRYAKDQTPVGSGQVTVHDTGGMSNNVIDYYCGSNESLYKSIQNKGINTGGKTRPSYAVPIQVRVVSGAPKAGKTL